MTLPPPPRASGARVPLRAAHSVRRTSSIDMDWPEGREGPQHLAGRARDIYTPAAGAEPVVWAEDALDLIWGPGRVLAHIAADPPRPSLDSLLGHRGPQGFRRLMNAAVPAERANATPLHLLLDDVAGATFVSGWAWSQWLPDWAERAAGLAGPDYARRMEGVCVGHRPGSSSFAPDRFETAGEGARAVPIADPDDPAGWHAMPPKPGRTMRRARWIDVTEDKVIRIAAAFQDSADRADGDGRGVVHEYVLSATADAAAMTLLSVEAGPRVLPYAECPLAADNLRHLVGRPLAALRDEVLVTLAGTEGCTHLNDAMRALAEVPALVARLRAARASDHPEETP